MKLSTFVLFLFSIKASQNRKLWEPPLNEISAPTIQEGEPITLQNNEDKVQIADLNGTLCSNLFSELRNVSEIRIIRNQIREIESGALCSSRHLKILELDLSSNRQPPTLTKNMFDNCNLEELFLKFDYNHPSKIDQNALEGLVNLKTLAIDSLEIPHLKKDFLVIGNKLTTLVLSGIHVTKIEANVFSDLTNVEELEIVHNLELTHLPQGLFKKLKKLKRLVLKDNAIKNLTWDEFEGLKSLEELDVVDNRITSLDVNKIAKNMPNIQKLFTELNPVRCKQREEIETELKTKLNHPVEVPNRFANIYEDCEDSK